MRWRHHHAIINGLHMHYVEQGQGLPVVLCHGFPHLWFSWHRQIAALAEAGYRVIAPDMRGMGQTEAPPEPAKSAAAPAGARSTLHGRWPAPCRRPARGIRYLGALQHADLCHALV